ncbi:MAG: cupredoxin domain-containing protein [Rhizomicrobium sp.]
MKTLSALIGAAAMSVAISAAASAATVQVAQQGRSFVPGEITIHPGDVVQISNKDEFIHQIYVNSAQMSFDSDEQPPGQNISIPFPKPGEFEVRCHIHPKMLLIVHVK